MISKRDDMSEDKHEASFLTANMIKHIQSCVFAIRWMLIPIYVGLVIALGVYIAHFAHEVIAMLFEFSKNYREQDILMLFLLELVDMAMISQLVVMTIQGGYAIFIRPFDEGNVDQRPQWIKHGLGTSEQKIKLGMSISGIMIVQLLKNFVGIAEGHALTQEQLWMREQMLACVLISTLMFCVYNLMMHHPILNKHDHKDHDNA